MFPLPNSLEQGLSSRTLGSQAITGEVCRWFAHLDNDPGSQEFDALALGILQRRPYFALLADLLHCVGHTCFAARDFTSPPSVITEAAHWQTAWSESCQRLVTDRDLAPVALRVATISNSGAVFEYLQSLCTEGTNLSVLCARSEPGGEGELLAGRLRSHDIRAQTLDDADLVRRLDSVDLLAVGADAVLPDAFINKVGTRALMARAGDLDLPVILVAESQKWAPQSWHMAARWLKTPDQGPMPVPMKWFESIELQRVSTIQCEFGPVAPELVARTTRAKPTYKPLVL